MKNYALLCKPGLNRLYAQQTANLCKNELSAAAKDCGAAVEAIKQASFAGIDYLLFSCPKELSNDCLRSIARLSAFFALFERLANGALLPIEAKSDFAFQDNIVTLLKYSGKTNEQFTHLMVNLAIYASLSCKRSKGRPWLLDPLCGRGTTIFTAARFGLEAVGIDLQASFIHEAQTFLTKYLERGRYKHTHTQQKRSNQEGRKIADLHLFNYALDKAAFKQNDLRQVQLIRADTGLTAELLPKRRFDFLATDLPYGIQHLSKPSEKNKAGHLEEMRNAAKLVENSISGWASVLKEGASVVMAYNTLTTPKEELKEALVKHGFKVLDNECFNGYAHKVDQAINRDIIAAVKL